MDLNVAPGLFGQDQPHQEQQHEQSNPLDSIMPNPQTTTIRGFHTDAQNKNPFALNFDTTSAEEQKRRRDRLARFEGEEAAQRLDYIEEQTKKAKSRLDRFENRDNDAQGSAGTDPLTASITYNFPAIMPFEQILLIPNTQTQHELAGFAPSAPRRWDTIHLFGSRLLLQNVRTEDLLHRYRSDGLINVEWQSDYRCNLVFTDQFSARRVLDQESYVRDLDVAAAAHHFPIQDPSKSEEENATSFEADALPFIVWRQSIFSEEEGTAKGSLSFRLATTADVKEPIEQRQHSQFYLDNDSYFADLLKYRKSKAKSESTEKMQDEEAPKPVVAPKLPEHVPVQGRPVVVKEGVVYRGRGFAKGRVGAFDLDRPVIQKANHRDSDMGTNDRQRDRTYGPRPQQPHVARDTPLSVTTEHLKAIEDRRALVLKERLEREALRDLKGQNHPMARQLLPREEQLRQQQIESEKSGRVHTNRTYDPSLATLRQQQLEMPQSGISVMYADIAPQDEEDRILREQERAEEKRIKEQEKAAQEAEKAARQARFDSEIAEQRAQEEHQRQIQTQRDEEQNALLEQQAQAEAAMGGNAMANDVADEDYA